MGLWPFGKTKVIAGPTGAFAIGGTRFDVMDPSTPAPNQRRVPVKAWYPAKPTTGAREPYLDDELRSALSDLMHIPKFLLPKNPSFTAVDAPAAPGRFPVLVFNHGFGSFQKQSSSLLEELASHGYVVLSVGHPRDSLVVQFADGSTLRHDPERPAWKAIRAGLKALEQQAREIEPLLLRARSASSLEDLAGAMQELAAHPSYAALVPVLEVWAGETRVVLEALDRLGDGDLAPALRGVVDAKQLGVFGHSLGGILAGQLAMTEPRVRAGISFDGAQLPARGARYVLQAPFAFLYADTTQLGKTSLTNAGMNDALVAHGPRGSCSAVITGAGHLNFTDMNNLSMAARALGSVDRGEMACVLRAATVGFFDRHLKGRPLAGFAASQTLRVLRAPS